MKILLLHLRYSLEEVILILSEHLASVLVPKLLTLYTHHWCMGTKNKIVKLTPQKIRYIIRYKTNNYSTKSIAKDLKISESTVKRVWMHWVRTKTPLNISKFGRKKKELDKTSEDLILKINKEAKSWRKTSGKNNKIHARKAYTA